MKPKKILEKFAYSEDIRNPKPNYLVAQALNDMDNHYISILPKKKNWKGVGEKESSIWNKCIDEAEKNIRKG